MQKKIKTCFITSEFPPQVGGAPYSAQRIVRALTREGYDITVLVFEDTGAVYDLEEEKQADRFHVHRFQMKGFFDDNKFVFQKIFKILKDFDDSHDFDLFHIFYLYPLGFIGTTVAKMNNKKSIVSIRGNDLGLSSFKPSRLSFIQAALRNANRITSVSSDLAELANSIWPCKEKTQVILNAIDAEHIHGFVKKTEENPQCIGTVGLFKEKKGIKLLLEAFKELTKKHKNLKLLLVGDFKEKKQKYLESTKLIKNLGPNRVELTGVVPHSQVFRYLNKMSVFVIPSGAGEGCPNVLLEAMAMEKAIVGGRAGAILEIIEDNKNGLMFDSDDKKELVKKIDGLLNSEERRKRLGSEAFKTVKGLSINKERKAWQEVYEETLKGNG